MFIGFVLISAIIFAVVAAKVVPPKWVDLVL